VSKPYVEMTLNTLKQFGIHIEHKALRSFSISGQQSYRACNYSIEGDWSSASYWLVASALGMPISVAGLNLTSLQADRSILDVFSAANCEVIQENDLIKINGKNKTSFSFDATDCPDLFPALTTFAALCPGTSEIKGVSRLQHKESNRGLTLQSEFAKLGIQIDLHDDLMIIHGKNQLIACQVSSHNDHRIAMCLAIAGMFSNSPLEIDGQEAVAKSYPRFWDDLESLVPIIN